MPRRRSLSTIRAFRFERLSIEPPPSIAQVIALIEQEISPKTGVHISHRRYSLEERGLLAPPFSSEERAAVREALARITQRRAARRATASVTSGDGRDFSPSSIAARGRE